MSLSVCEFLSVCKGAGLFITTVCKLANRGQSVYNKLASPIIDRLNFSLQFINRLVHLQNSLKPLVDLYIG